MTSTTVAADEDFFYKNYDDYVFDYMCMQEAFARQFQSRAFHMRSTEAPKTPIDSSRQHGLYYVGEFGVWARDRDAAVCSRAVMAGRAIERRLKISIVAIRGREWLQVQKQESNIHRLGTLYQMLTTEEHQRELPRLLSGRFVAAYDNAIRRRAFRRHPISSPWHYGNDVLSLNEWDNKRCSFRGTETTSVAKLFSDMDECRWWTCEYTGEHFDRELPWIMDGPWNDFLKETESVFRCAHEYRRNVELQKATAPVEG